ncbi:MAG: HTH domain-containing protein [Geodermatophilaceae bacterium]|nr:HTH domain-containing protein [Geodermatophilaceae bacterium]
MRRVERQHALVERLAAARGQRRTVSGLAREFGVAERTLARDVERLRDSGVPLRVVRGRGGGVSLDVAPVVAPIAFDLAEVAALMSSLTVLGPWVSPSATSAMRKLAAAVGSDGGSEAELRRARLGIERD